MLFFFRASPPTPIPPASCRTMLPLLLLLAASCGAQELKNIQDMMDFTVDRWQRRVINVQIKLVKGGKPPPKST